MALAILWATSVHFYNHRVTAIKKVGKEKFKLAVSYLAIAP